MYILIFNGGKIRRLQLATPGHLVLLGPFSIREQMIIEFPVQIIPPDISNIDMEL